MREIRVSDITRRNRLFGLSPGLTIGFALLLVSSCARGTEPTSATGPASDETAARQTLIQFFDDLRNRDYESAVDLYGGTYENMLAQNPSMNPVNRAALLRAACTLNGAQCLEIRSAQLDAAKSTRGDEYTFIVEFNQADGSRFSLGPCCGAATGGAQPQSRFPFHVRKTADKSFKVMTPPVYTP